MYCKVPQRHGQWVLEYHSLEAAFPIWSTDPHPDSEVSMDLWHQHLGHLHKEAIEQLPMAVEGAKITKNSTFSSPCEVCRTANATQKISRQKSQRASRPYNRVHLDLIQMAERYNGDRWVL